MPSDFLLLVRNVTGDHLFSH